MCYLYTMNIFYIDECPIKSAQMQVDRHVVKMILESAQMLSTAHRILDGDDNVDPILYKSTHKNHPCSKWCRESLENYEWLYHHFCSLCDEYTHRYGKIHLTDSKLREPLSCVPRNIPKIGFTKVAQAMPECYKNDNPVLAYREYYNAEKQKFASWTNRIKPFWFELYSGI